MTNEYPCRKPLLLVQIDRQIPFSFNPDRIECHGYLVGFRVAGFRFEQLDGEACLTIFLSTELQVVKCVFHTLHMVQDEALILSAVDLSGRSYLGFSVSMPSFLGWENWPKTLREFLALEDAGIRTELDRRGEKIGYKIREAQQQKVPYMVIVGQKEAESGTLSIRNRAGEETHDVSEDAFIAQLKEEIRAKAR